MASSREPDQGLPVKKQDAVPQNVNLPPILPKNKKKPYPIPLKKIQWAARADKKLAEKGTEKPLGPPKNGVHNLIPVAYEVLEAWKVSIKGPAQLLSVIPVYGCRCLLKLKVGHTVFQIQKTFQLLSNEVLSAVDYSFAIDYCKRYSKKDNFAKAPAEDRRKEKNRSS